jgi:hypothetical protein
MTREESSAAHVETWRARSGGGLVASSFNGVLVTGSGRVLRVGDSFAANESISVILGDVWSPFVRPRGRLAWEPEAVASVLVPVAVGLFGWLR